MSNPNRHRHVTVTHHHSPPKSHPKLLFIILKLFVMSLILSFFLIFLGLAVIFLLHILLAGSFHRRRRRQHTTPPTPTSRYSLLDLQTHLPAFRYSDPVSPTECSICLECFKDGDFCRALPVCGHLFHANCVDLWLTKVPNCPFCRAPVRLEVDRPSDLIVSDDESKSLWTIGVGRQVVMDY